MRANGLLNGVVESSSEMNRLMSEYELARPEVVKAPIRLK